MRWIALLLCLLAAPAWAQSGSSVRQSGNVTPTHAACWTTNGVVQDCGPATLGFLTSLGVTASGPGFCQNSGPVTSAYNQFCINVTQTGGASLSLYNYNGASGGFSFNINGTLQGFALVSLPVVVGDAACFTNTSGNLVDCGSGVVTSVALALPASVFTVSGSPVTSSGTLTGAFASQTANYVFAAPNGSSGTPTFRSLVGADIPAINLATGVTGTLGATNGGTGANNSSSTGVAQWSSGTYSVSTALANGTTATTQSESDTSTKVATDGFVANITTLSSLVTVGTLTGGSTSAGFTVGNGTALSGTLSGNPVLSGIPQLSGLISGTCSNAVGLDSGNHMILIACPGAASSVQVGSTSITSGTNGYLLYNNSGTLGNETLASVVNAAGGMTKSGTTAVTLNSPGGWLNKFRNGPFDVWQRGTSSLATSTSGAYTADGWIVTQTGAAFTCQRNGTGDEGTLYGLICVGGASNTDTLFSQRIESYIAAPLAGQTVTVQFAFYQTSGSSVTPKVSACYASAQDNFSTCTSDLAATSLTSCATATWCVEAYTFNVSASATTGYQVTFDCNTALTSAQYCMITAADIRVTPGVATGINANPPPPELRPIGVELAFSQRYYQTSYDNGVAPATATHVGFPCTVGVVGAGPSNAAGCPFRVSMRADPASVSTWDGNGNSGRCSYFQASSWIDNYTCNNTVVATGQNGFVVYTSGAGQTNPTVFWWAASAEL